MKIEDSGRGSADARGTTSGVGLNNVRKRLELCFGPGTRVDSEFSASGSVVEVRVPSRLSRRSSDCDWNGYIV